MPETPSTPPENPNDDDFRAPESESFWQLVEHVMDQMRGHVIVAIGLVGFMFFYGMINSTLFLVGRPLSTFEYPIGVIFGIAGSLAVTAFILRIKYRRKK